MADFHNFQSEYQKIVVSTDPMHYGEHILYLDDMWQYNSTFEFKYHEVIATLPAVCCPDLFNVLICGGGDGLAAREILRFPDVHLDLVEIDKAVINLFQSDSMLTTLNRNSLLHDKIKIHCQDAVKFADNAEPGLYDLIILDFPSPGDGNLKKDYNNLFTGPIIEKFARLTKRFGIIACQTSVPTGVLAPYVNFMLEKGWSAWNLDNYYDKSNSHDNFTFFSRTSLIKERQIPKECKYITDRHVEVAFSTATEITQTVMDYYRLFEHAEDIEIED